jgi:ABC-type transporter Mla maintaining outer membrane lipid asymmetry ATPase subunit MlaF
VPYVFRIVDKVALLEDCRIVFAGTPEEVMACDNPTVRAFVDGGIPADRPDPGRSHAAAGTKVED